MKKGNMKQRLIFSLSLVGLFISALLWWMYTSPSRPMFCVGSGCDEVRSSSYAVAWGIPLPVYGVAMYAGLVLLSLAAVWSGAGRRQAAHFAKVPELARNGTLFIAGAGFLVSLYLTGLEAFVIEAWCIWCVASALIITAVFGLSIWEVQRPSAPISYSASNFTSNGSGVLPRVKAHLAILACFGVLSVPAWWLLTRPGEPVGPTGVARENLERLHRADSHWIGPEGAELVLVEFADLQCGGCARAEAVLRQLRDRYRRRMRYTLRHYPLTTHHPHAWKAAEAAECASEQGKYWKAVETFFEHQKELEPEGLKRHAKRIGLDEQAFGECLDSGRMAARVRRDKEDGAALGVRATPTFFLGERPLTGVPTLAQFTELIEAESAKNGGEGSSVATDNGAQMGSDREPSAEPVTAGSGGPNPGNDRMVITDPSTSSMGEDGAFGSLGGPFGGCTEDLPPEPPRIGLEAAHRLYTDGSEMVFLDVRDADVFRKGHIRGARNLPLSGMREGIKKLPKDRKIVIVIYGQSTSTGDPCAESRATGRVLLARGFVEERLAVFADGYEAWQKAGYPIETAEKGP